MQKNDSPLLTREDVQEHRNAMMKQYIMSLSPIERLFMAARVNPNSPRNRHLSHPLYGMGRHIVGRTLRQKHKQRKKALKEKVR